MTKEQRLRVLGVVDDDESAQLIQHVFEEEGDDVDCYRVLSKGVSGARNRPPDLAFIDVMMGQRAGLALVHHVKAVAPHSHIMAIVKENSMDAASQALSLGATGLILFPACGDDLLTPAAEVRARLAAVSEVVRLREEQREYQSILLASQELALIAEYKSIESMAKPVARLFRRIAAAEVSALYLPASKGSNELRRAAIDGELSELIAFTDEMGMMKNAHQLGLEVVPLLAGRLSAGHILLKNATISEVSVARRSLDLLASQAAVVFNLALECERGGRAAIKDPETSAYSFAYFVDIAGREIDKAQRHNRRFALATLACPPPTNEHIKPIAPGDVAELVLGVVRDSDVLARVDENEFYLLLPETNGVGAHACRRRILQIAREKILNKSEASAWESLVMGVAAFPHDGEDLSKLLRLAKRRADVSFSSTVHRLRLQRLSLDEMVDALLWDVEIARGTDKVQPESPRVIELPMADVIGLVSGAINQAIQSGGVQIITTEREGLSLMSGIRAPIRDAVNLHTVDVRSSPGCEDIEALSIFADQAAYALLGRVDHGMFHGVHAADPLLADLAVNRLAEIAGVHFWE
jgi:CheY-like chemotaxis protein